MRGVYTGTVIHSALAAAKDLYVLTAPSSKVLEVLRAWITNSSNETNEQLVGVLIRASAAGTGAATSIVKKPHEVGDKASDSTLEHTYATTQPTLEADPLAREGITSLSGVEFIRAPEERIYVQPSGIFVIRITTTTFTALDVTAGITWREIG